jgi:hypothetical protein
MHLETVGTDTPSSAAIRGVEKFPRMTSSSTCWSRISIVWDRSYHIDFLAKMMHIAY